MERKMHPVEETFKNYLNERFNNDKNINTGTYVQIATFASFYRFMVRVSSDMVLRIEFSICKNMMDGYDYLYVDNFLFSKNKKINTYNQVVDLGRKAVLNKEKAKEIVDELLNKLNITNDLIFFGEKGTQNMNKTIMTAEDIIDNKNEEIKMLKSRIEDTIALIKLMNDESSCGEFNEIHLDDIIAKLMTGTSCYENKRDSKELKNLNYLYSEEK